MEVHLDPDREARLSQIAALRGVQTDELAQEVLNRYLEDNERFIEAVNAGLAAADRGEFVEHEQVWSEVENILQQP